MECIFCKIVNGDIPVKRVYEDEHVVAFNDASPVAPVHVLVIPKKHIESILTMEPKDMFLTSHIVGVVQKLAIELGLSEDGFRLVINTKKNGGQTVYHLHWHMIGARFMTWPPG